MMRQIRPVICCALGILLIMVPALAEFDAGSYTTDELREIQAQIEEALEERESEVTEPESSDAETDISEFVYVSDGEGIIIRSYIGSAAKVVIPAEIDGLPVTEIGEQAFHLNKTIEEVVLPETVTRIDEEAFYQCPNLRTVNIEYVKQFCDRCFAFSGLDIDVTSKADNVYYYASAFWNTSVNNLIVTSKTAFFGKRAFGLCFGLRTVYIDEGTGVLTEGNSDPEWGIFEECGNLESFIVSGNMGMYPTEMFYKTPKLTIYTEPDSYAVTYAQEKLLPCNTKDYQAKVDEFRPKSE